MAKKHEDTLFTLEIVEYVKWDRGSFAVSPYVTDIEADVPKDVRTYVAEGWINAEGLSAQFLKVTGKRKLVLEILENLKATYK